METTTKTETKETTTYELSREDLEEIILRHLGIRVNEDRKISFNFEDIDMGCTVETEIETVTVY